MLANFCFSPREGYGLHPAAFLGVKLGYQFQSP